MSLCTMNFRKVLFCLLLLLYWEIYWLDLASIIKISDMQSLQRLSEWQADTPGWSWKWHILSSVCKSLSQHARFAPRSLVAFIYVTMKNHAKRRGNLRRKGASLCSVFHPCNKVGRFFISVSQPIQLVKTQSQAQVSSSWLHTVNVRHWESNALSEGKMMKHLP